MTDLRKAAEEALDALKWTTEFMTEQKRLEAWQAMDMLEQALAQPEQGNSSPNYPITESITTFVDAVNISQEPVDETAKREHEPVAWVQPNGEIVVRTDYGGRLYYSEQNVYTEQRIKEAILAEREACAKVVEADGLARGDEGLVLIKAAGRIRARGEK